jgi:predicted HicB family RNase H-like nuclease
MERRNPAQTKPRPVAALRVRVRPSVKAAAVRMAQEDKCSMAEWLEWLIEAEKARLDGKKVRG